jgi:hypothetical protein
MSVWIQTYQDPGPLAVPQSPFHCLTTFSRSELARTRNVPAEDRRLLTDHFVDTFQWETVHPHLPIRLELPPGVQPWKARTCRSFYEWLPPEDIHSADDLIGLDSADGYIRMIWCYASSISHLGAQSWVSASAALSDLLLSILSASVYAGCSFAGATGPGPSWSQNCTPKSAGWATVCVLGLTPTTCQPNPPSAWRSQTQRLPGCSSARTA